ncbi:ABC transporter ATP-binding protein [Methylocaldum szegediense]|uniref:Aliphatic sulfonates import ATP-binding protein SsuB n=1 Tax=Methylocaldum szegediense TaxID=73780 RepID=A0ABM9I220_9GAMM|nr:ABC transporter ATP-binding protein [Methylocaldum szegediense]CAI8829186.1 Aliphatic sulfonates import ATP-binding protein SsuB [Methylocaldum szegediense]
MTAIQIQIVRKTYRPKGETEAPLILKDLSIRLGSGEFACLVGPSGCGKTTLLNIAAGLDRDFEGSVRIETDTDKPHIGYVFQNPRLIPWRTVRENIELALPKEADPAYIDHLFEVVGLADAQNVFPERLSLGMSRRVALVRAFAVNPDLLLMDEPFVSLDPPTARRVRELVVTLWQERPHTVLFVTHDLREAIELADRLIFLSSQPTSVICDIPVDIPRLERNETAIETFRQQLYADHAVIRTLL